MVATTYAQLEDAIARVPGVAHVSVGTSNGSGKGRLRIRLAPEADPENVANTVAILLDTNFGIRIPPEAIRPVVAPVPAALAVEARSGAVSTSEPAAPDASSIDDPVDDLDWSAVVTPGPESGPQVDPQPDPRPDPRTGPHDRAAPPAAAPAPASDPAAEPEEVASADPGLADVMAAIDRDGADVDVDLPASVIAPRPLITDLQVTGTGLDVFVTAELEINGRPCRGEATCAATLPATLRAVCRATIDALRDLLADEARIELESVTQEELDGRDSVAVAVTWLTRETTDRLIGVSYLRDDAAHSAMRATLDAVNRRLAQLRDA